MNNETIQYIISRLVDRALDVSMDVEENPEDGFQRGRKLAYYEVLDIIKSELYVKGEDLTKYGLDINLEKLFL